MRRSVRAISLILATALTASLTGCVPSPRFKPPAGKYRTPQVVTIAYKDPDATIFYTTDGSTPSESSPKYTGPVVIARTSTLQAIAVTRGKQSGVARAKYRLNAPVVPQYVVVGSGNTTNTNPLFGIIDFSNPSSPNEVDVTTVAGGTIVACSGPYVAVGDANGGRVWIYSIANNIANPTAPPLGVTDTKLKPIGALTYNGNYILAGGASGGSVVLIDATNPASPNVFLPGLATGVINISSVGLSGSHGIDSGPMSSTIDIIDYTNPAHPPPAISFKPDNLGIGLSADLDGTLAAVGDQTSSKVDLVDITAPRVVSTCLPPACQASSGINAISINAAQKLVAVGSNNDFNMYLIDFSNLSAPTATLVPPPGGAGGWTVALDSSATHLAAGNVVGTNVALFSISGTKATLLNHWFSKINLVTTICVSNGAAPPAPALTVSPHNLAFSATQGGGTPAAQILSVDSTGAALSFAVTSGATWLTATPGGNTPGSVRVSVNPAGLASGSYTGSVVLTSSGASNSPQSIPVTLTVSRPALTLNPSSLAFSSAPGGTPARQTVSVGSTGAALSFADSTSGTTWLTATPSGNTPGTVRVSVNTAGLSSGSYTGSVVLTSPGASNSPQTVPVSLTIGPSTIILGSPADAGQGNYYPFGGYSGRYQQLYTNAAFSGPITIKALKFFNTQTNSGVTSIPSGTWTISLSTTSADWNTLSSNFAANVGPNNLQVFTGNLSQGWAFGNTLTINLTTPFTYVPANGNLLMDVTASNINVTPGRYVYFDTTGYDGGRRDGSTIIGHVDSDGAYAGYGLVTGFSF